MSKIKQMMGWMGTVPYRRDESMRLSGKDNLPKTTDKVGIVGVPYLSIYLSIYLSMLIIEN